MNREATLQKLVDDFRNSTGIIAEIRDASLLLSEIMAFLAGAPDGQAKLFAARHAHAAMTILDLDHMPLLEARLAEAKADPSNRDVWVSLIPILLSILKQYLKP